MEALPRTRSGLRDEVRRLADRPNLNAAEEARFEAAIAALDTIGQDTTRSATRSAGGEVRDQALKILETEGRSLAPRQQDHLDNLLRSRSADINGDVIARRMIDTENPAYRSAFAKYIAGSSPVFTPEESQAVNLFRAANEGTGSAGGFGIPVLIDPSIILSSGALEAPILSISRQVTITTDVWKGVSSAGVSWSYDSEASAVSDDTTTLSQPVINVYAARGYIPYSIELGQDYPGFADEMALVLSQGYVDLLASQTAVGSGSSSPRGIFTAMAATTTNPSHVLVTTAGTLDANSVRTAWSALPERFRPRATWVMSPGVEAKVRAFGNNLALSDFTVNLNADGVSVLTGRPVVVTDYAPAFVGTTGTENYAVVGDFSNFLIVQRAGMTVENIATVFDQSTGRPTGQRGLFAWARHGHDVVNANAFRLLANS
jgi:HK97 family phage major capsid protein